MNSDRLLQRFLRYVAIDTMANDNADTYPSSPGQLELGRILVAELQEIGLSDAEQDDYGLVMATIPASQWRYRGALDPGVGRSPGVARSSDPPLRPVTESCSRSRTASAAGEKIFPPD